MSVGDLKADDGMSARGVANVATELDMIQWPSTGELVPIVQHHGVHVCWGCMEPFDEVDPKLRMVAMRPPGSVVRVAIHAKCVNPENRKLFSDMGGSRELQSVDEVSRGLQLRRRVASVVKASANVAIAAANKLVTL